MSIWSVVGEAWMRLRLVSPLSQVISSPPHQPTLQKKKPKKNPTLSNMRSDERWKSFPRLLKRKYKRKPTRLHLFYLIIFPFCGRERGQKGREEKSLRRTGEAGSGLRWRGGDGIDINPSNACLSLFSFPILSLSGLWQKNGRKHKDTLLIRGVHSGLICLVTARNLFLFFFLFSFGVRKRRSKLSSPSKQHWRLGGFFLFFPQREWTENLGFKVLVFFFLLLFVLCHERDEGRWFLMEVKVTGAGRIPS